MLFIGIELLAIPTYALVALLKQQEMAVEAGLKYFLLGMFASVDHALRRRAAVRRARTR